MSSRMYMYPHMYMSRCMYMQGGIDIRWASGFLVAVRPG